VKVDRASAAQNQSISAKQFLAARDKLPRPTERPTHKEIAGLIEEVCHLRGNAAKRYPVPPGRIDEIVHAGDGAAWSGLKQPDQSTHRSAEHSYSYSAAKTR
jgi:hypothetical protein